jgi:hypothetical protein
LHYPLYWHYDFLGGLRAMAEAGMLSDPRCAPALDLLESRRLPGGGFPREERFEKPLQSKFISGQSPVTWGENRRARPNEFVSIDAWQVLSAAGRWSPAKN